MSEKLYLQWNDFRENVNSAFGKLRHNISLGERFVNEQTKNICWACTGAAILAAVANKELEKIQDFKVCCFWGCGSLPTLSSFIFRGSIFFFWHVVGVWPERAILVKHLSDFSPHFALSGTDRPEGKFMWIADLWGLSGEWRIKQIELSPFEDFWDQGASKGEKSLQHWRDLTNGLKRFLWGKSTTILMNYCEFPIFSFLSDLQGMCWPLPTAGPLLSLMRLGNSSRPFVQTNNVFLCWKYSKLICTEQHCISLLY